MFRRDVAILLGVLLVLVLLFLVLVRPYGSGDREDVAPGDLLAPDLAPEDAHRVAIAGPAGSVALVRGGSGWTIEGDQVRHANPERVAEALRLLGRTTRTELVSVVPGKHAVFEVDEAGTRVTVTGGGATLADVVIGKRGPDFLSAYVRAADEDEVYLSPGGLASALPVRADQWRDRSLISFEPGTATRFTIAGEEGRVVLASGGEGVWMMEEPRAGAANAKAVERALFSLARLTASGFADDLTPAECGLDPEAGAIPAATVTVELSSGETRSLWIGDREEKSYCVRRPDRATVYRLPASLVERFLVAPGDLLPELAADGR